jgi:hypothetical protein
VARAKSPVVRDDEVTDILDDNDIVAPLMQSLPRDQIQPKTQSTMQALQTPSKSQSARTQWNIAGNSLDDSADI